SLNDAGVIAFVVRGQGEGTQVFSAYVWENGTITPVAGVGTEAPGGGKLLQVRAVWGNNKNRNLLLYTRVRDNNPAVADFNALYLVTDGKLSPVIVEGQEMPGGGKFRSIQFGLLDLGARNAGESNPTGVSYANEA